MSEVKVTTQDRTGHVSTQVVPVTSHMRERFEQMGFTLLASVPVQKEK